jgi:ketosteroid isomerase-like protein
MSATDEVREASKQFYAGLNRMANGDASPLADIWSHSEMVTAMHPIGGRNVGWEAIREAFDQVAGAASDGKIELQNQRIHVAGDMACESGVEDGTFRFGGHPVSFKIRVTNVYQREAGTWKMIHHHTDVSPEMLDVLKRL